MSDGLTRVRAPRCRSRVPHGLLFLRCRAHRTFSRERLGSRRNDGTLSRGCGLSDAIFGAIGIVGALASIAFSRNSWPWALSAVAAQVVWIVVYRSVAAPVNAELTRQARTGSVPIDARALQARWDSVIVARVFLMGFAVVALAAALARSAP